MKNGVTEFYVVDLNLKDNKGIIKDCVIFENDERGQHSIQDFSKIEDIINRTDYFTYQNRCTNGKANILALENYNIKIIKAEEF